MSHERAPVQNRRKQPKSRDRNRVAVEAPMVHGHIIAARRADLMRQMETVRRAIYASQTDLDQLSST
jgi:hypothetical protein